MIKTPKMGVSSASDFNCCIKSNSLKVIALEISLQQSIEKFRDLVVDHEQLYTDSENYKLQYLSVKDKCENKTCAAAEELKKIIVNKDEIIQSVAITLTKLNETKNFNFLTDAFKLLFGNATPLTPPKEDKSSKNYLCTSSTSTKNMSPIKENINTKNEVDISITDDVSFKEQSLCEIDGTPTGRMSPIIHTKKTKSTLAKSSDFRDKKKCPDDWLASDSKVLKLTPTPSRSKPNRGGKLRQSRLNLVKIKQMAIVDLTCSPEALAQMTDQLVQPPIKKESIENDDTILPSPTSGPINFTFLKSASNASPSKFKKPPLSLKYKLKNVSKQDENKDTSNNTTNTEMEGSINILNHFANRVHNGIKKENETMLKKVKNTTEEKDTIFKKQEDTTVKKEKDSMIKKETGSLVKIEVPQDDDTTHCETNASISLLQHIDQLEEDQRIKQHSPSKRPLAENINIMNTPPKQDAESSMSILRPEPKTAAVENVKRTIPELVDPVYKEETVRKKADKRNLQGWSCEECMNFYGELYKNDPVMLAKKINDCSKHRGKHNPARPKTPPNFWNPRWHVPDDTEELNRMNNAI